jgi:iron complex outermembrane receptor protein
VPLDVQAFSDTQLAGAAVQTVADLGQIAPGLVVNQGIAVPAYIMRGVGVFSNTLSTEQDVSLYVDGVYRPAAIASVFSLNTVKGVEVAKGPQGTLFGRNAIGGVILVTTRDPSDTPELELNVGYGNYSTLTASAYASTPVTDELSANLAVYYNNQSSGWGTNFFDFTHVHTGNEIAASTKWVYETGSTKVTFSADYDRAVSPMTEVALISGLYDRFPYTYGQPHVGGYWDTYQPIRPYNRVTQVGASLKIEQDLEWAQLVSVTAGRHTDSFLIQFAPLVPPYQTFGAAIPPAVYLDASHDQRERTYTQEIDLFSPESSEIKWTAGMFYLNDWAGGFPQSGGLVRDKSHTKSIAGFAQATVPVFSDDNHLTLGYRFTYDNRDIEGTQFADRAETTVLATEADNPDAKHSWTNSSYKVAIDHAFTPDILAYVSNSTGYQSGYYNLSAGPAAPPTEPETIRSTEVGLKASLLDNTLRLNLAGYYYTIDNLVVTIVQVDPLTGRNHTVVQNAAATQGKGIDLQAEYKPFFAPRLTLSGGFNILDATYSNFANALFLEPSGNGLTWSILTGDASGNYVQGSEKFAATFQAQYDIPLGDDGALSLVANVAHHSGAYADSQNLAKQPPYTVMNTTANWTADNGKYNVMLWARNLTNAEYPSNIGASTSQWTFNPAPPRTYGVTLGVKF